MKKLLAGLMVFFFWAYSPTTGALYKEGGFILPSDCNTVRAWVGSQQPVFLVVSPACYPEGVNG